MATEVDWQHQYRIIAAEFSPINFFEQLVDPELMEALYYVESLTNDRLRDAVGDISLVAPEDRIFGPGSPIVMAAFTHVSPAKPNRFSDGTFGVYYAAKTLQTAIAETKFHRARFLAYTQEEPGQIDMRVYIGEVDKPLNDIRGSEYRHLHNPDDWSPSQAFGYTTRKTNAWGIVYCSVRDSSGHCIAALRPPAVTIPRPGPHLTYLWDGKTIASVYEKKRID